MNKPPSFQFYAQDFLTGVMYLTNEEVGIYIKMLAKQWTDGKIPLKRLGFLVGIEWENFSEELRSKFILKKDYLFNERLEKEREKKEIFLKKQSENGSKGGRPRKKNPKKPKPLIRVNPNKSQKKPLEDEDEIEIDKEYKEYKSEFLKNENQILVENFYMKFKFKTNVIEKVLDDFILHLGFKDKAEHHKTFKSFKNHFYNWCNTQDGLGNLKKYKNESNNQKITL